MKVLPETKLDFNNVCIVPTPTELSSRKDVTIERIFKFLNSHRTWTGFPIISANMDSVSTIEMARALHKQKALCAIHKHYSVDELVKFYTEEADVALNGVFYTLGMNEADWNKYKEVKNRLGYELPFVCLDVANGYMTKFLDFIKKFKDENPTSVVMAGNVVTDIGAKNILDSGASIVKCGIGSGSACRTRVVAATGIPQLSAILDTVDCVHSNGGLLCSDGGIVEIGDVSKALGAGADFVMMGGMLSGHDESGGELFTDEHGNKKKLFYGMSSETAMNKHNGGMASHRSSEGRTVAIDYRGPVENTINEIKGGVRSAMTYTNSKDLDVFPDNVQFVKVHQVLNTSLAGKTTGK